MAQDDACRVPHATMIAGTPRSRSCRPRLDAWVDHYNTERPHQALGMRPPIDRFRLAAPQRDPAVETGARASTGPGRAAGGGAGRRRLCGCPGCSAGSTSTG